MTKSHSNQYDVIVIGSGGGMKIALTAADMGMKTALIEEDAVAGTCLNRGCIPSKMLIYPTELPGLISHAHKINVLSDNSAQVDFPALIQRISQTVDGMSNRQRSGLTQKPNLDFYPQHAEFVANKTLRVADKELTADKIFIATGSRPSIPNIAGLKDTPFMTSKEALRRTDLPRHLLVLGAGYIAVELGGAYAAAGSEVEFIVRSQFLRKEDSEIANEFSRLFSQSHTLHTGFVPQQISYDQGQFIVVCLTESGQQKTLTGDALLVATGVTPCTDTLGLEHTGIDADLDGFIRADEYLQTTVEGVYALGDCVGNYLYRHTVNHEAAYLCKTALHDSSDISLDYGPVPHAVFGGHEIAGVGMTEEQVREQRLDYVTGKADYADSNAGLARGYDHGFAKILVERTSRRILGAHILGEEASDMIHLFIVLMKTNGTLDDLLDMIFIHPALPEVARDAARDATQKLN